MAGRRARRRPLRSRPLAARGERPCARSRPRERRCMPRDRRGPPSPGGLGGRRGCRQGRDSPGGARRLATREGGASLGRSQAGAAHPRRGPAARRPAGRRRLPAEALAAARHGILPHAVRLGWAGEKIGPVGTDMLWPGRRRAGGIVVDGAGHLAPQRGRAAPLPPSRRRGAAILHRVFRCPSEPAFSQSPRVSSWRGP